MYQNLYREYVDNEILSADPARLVQMLYRGALDAIGAARRALAAGEIEPRSRQISKATAILNELALSLDHAQAPELCRNLVELYDYTVRRLIEANVQQADAPLAEVERLLGIVLEGWQEADATPAEVPMHVGYATEPQAGYERLSYAW